ncbi:hypothetical protein JCM19046_4726 [Bacillus sp. JCM 19046]|nr:hypothetical protein JCM19045_3042 [Bacillus sp. JCM 19045]GAF20025.1 hypothetical protein JCM19046_4726 [Bacillus sp. JCM 19046]
MYHLIKLELKKHKIGWYIKGALLANGIILALLYFFTVIEQLENEVVFQSSADFYLFAGVLIRGTFIVFASVLISRMVIDEFKNKTSIVLFSYPISRKTIMASKLVFIFVLTLLTMMVSTLVVVLSFIGLHEWFHFSDNLQFTSDQLFNQLFVLTGFNLVAAGTALVPLYFGLLKFSTPATILSSILIVIVTSSSFGPEFSLINILYVPIVLAFIGLLITFLAVRKVNHLELH